MKTIHLIANGDLRIEANQTCEAAQAEMEKQLVSAIEKEGAIVSSGRTLSIPRKSMASSTARSTEWRSSSRIPADEPLIVAESVWQYSHHVLHGLLSHRGPILTVANWSGTWPGLVGLLNLNGSLAKAGVKFSSLWSENFDDDFFSHGTQKMAQDRQDQTRRVARPAPRRFQDPECEREDGKKIRQKA